MQYVNTLGNHQPLRHRHAAMHRFRHRVVQTLCLLLIVAAATLMFDFVVELGKYNPTVDEPKDLDRELRELHQKQIKKVELMRDDQSVNCASAASNFRCALRIHSTT